MGFDNKNRRCHINQKMVLFLKLEQNPYMELKLNTIAWPPCKGFYIALKKVPCFD